MKRSKEAWIKSLKMRRTRSMVFSEDATDATNGKGSECFGSSFSIYMGHR